MNTRGKCGRQSGPGWRFAPVLILAMLIGSRVAVEAAPADHGPPVTARTVAGWPVELQECLSLLRQNANARVSESVIALLARTPALATTRWEPSLMVVAYRWRQGQVQDLVVQLFTDPQGGEEPAMLNPHGLVHTQLGNELYNSADHLLGLLYDQVNYVGDFQEVRRQQRAFVASVQGDLTLLREQTVEPLRLVAILPHSAPYLPRSLRSRVQSLVLNAELQFGEWHGELVLTTGDDDAAEQVGNIMAAWRELAVSLVEAFASYGTGQGLHQAMKGSLIRVDANRVLASASIPAVTAVRMAKEMAGHGPPKKVLMCHRGHTISVSEDAMPAHLAQGDTVGSCPGDPAPGGGRGDHRDGDDADDQPRGNPPDHDRPGTNPGHPGRS